jgi:hypothetical protein
MTIATVYTLWCRRKILEYLRTEIGFRVNYLRDYALS